MDNQELQDLDYRLRRLENMHLWGGTIIIVGLVYLFLKGKTNDKG